VLLFRAVGLHEAGGRDPVEILVTYLRKRDTLIPLDNCEHVVEACATLANVLARGCPRPWILATSRQVLGLTGELVVPVEGLEVPDRAQGGEQIRLGGSAATIPGCWAGTS
jgi:predicted ATPase